MKHPGARPRKSATQFTSAQIVELRTRRAAGESLKSLAQAFNTIPEYVSFIARGKIHEDAGGPITEPFQVSVAERRIEFQGVTLSATKWAQRQGMSLSALVTRLHRGWSVEDALTVPHREAPSKIVIPPGPSIAYVALNDGHFACIDVDSIPLIQDKVWFAAKYRKSGRMYPATHTRSEFLSMRTLILGDKQATPYAVNGNILDCRVANLRRVTKAQSSWRNARRSTNKTGYTGVSWNKAKKRFIARLQTNGVNERVGSFTNLEEAVAALDRAALRLRGEFARLQYDSSPTEEQPSIPESYSQSARTSALG